MSRRHEEPGTTMLEVQTGEYRGVPLIRLRGEVDSSTVKYLHLAIDDVLFGSADILLIDFAGLTYLDSAGLNVLFDTTRAMSNRGWVGAVAPNAVVHKLLDMGGLTHLPCFRVFEDLDAVRLDD